MRESTAQDYNTESRTIEFRVDIYFNGLSQEPLEVTRDNYLIDLSFLDEACADGTTFVGKPSANEISFTLYSEAGMFNPVNRQSIYYNKIKIGIPIKAYCRPVIADEEIEWDALGLFYVVDWNTEIVGISAAVTANDNMSKLLTGFQTKVPIHKNYSIVALISDFFLANGYTFSLKGTLPQILPYAYIQDTNAKFLQEISTGALLWIYVDRQGNFIIQALDNTTLIDYELTDSDQIMSINSEQSIITTAEGVSIEIQQPQLSNEQEVLNIRDITVPPLRGINYSKQALSATPLVALSHAALKSEADCVLDQVRSSVYDLSYRLTNPKDASIKVDLSFYGYTLDTIAILLGEEGDDILKLSNIYIQTEEAAQRVHDIMYSYLKQVTPVLELNIRGNPKYKVGDKLHIYSEKYNVDFTGWLIRQNYKYNGGLSSTIKVLNSAIIGG